jgi:AcrR family transcriptional regulator
LNERFIYPRVVARVEIEERLAQVVEAAGRVFARRGYRRTRMSDVARELGVAPGTLYTYVVGKEALFDLCLQRAFLDGEPPLPPALPVPTPAKEDVVAHLRERLRTMGRFEALRAALSRERAEDPAAELRAVIGEQYENMVRHQLGFALLERSAADRPELAEVYFGRARGGLLRHWSRYLGRRITAGQLRPVPDVDLAARLLIEAIAWFAWHRHGDPHPVPMDDRAACETICVFATRALVAEVRP